MKDFRDLKVWQAAHELTLMAYRATAPFPKEELYGLTSQIRRAGASVAANIAKVVEGAATPNSIASCRWLRDRQVSWNTTSCWRATLASCLPRSMSGSKSGSWT